MMAAVSPDRVVCGAFEQGHLDHDSTHWLVTHSFGGPILEVPFYHVYTSRLQVLNRFSDPTREEIWPLGREDQKFKIEFAKGYPSQNIWSILFWYEVWKLLMGRPAKLRETERMRCWKGADYRTPAHPLGISHRVLVVPLIPKSSRPFRVASRSPRDLRPELRCEAQSFPPFRKCIRNPSCLSPAK